MDELVRLAANAVPGEERYVVVAGAGLSKDAGHPTAWDILLETAKLLRAAEGGDENQPIEDWFMASPHRNQSYATMISTLYPSPVEQQDFLARQLPVMHPGQGHELIAELALRGVIRALITTNFDDLLERAIRQRGMDVQVIASEADFRNVAPLIHCPAIRIYKPHGTLGVGTLRNTPADIQTLPDAIMGELQRVFDDHGLIVVGHGGADPGLMSVLERRRRSLYPVYWLHLGDHPPAGAIAALGDSLVAVRTAGASRALGELIRIQDLLARLSATGAFIDPSSATNAIAEGRKDSIARIRDFMHQIFDAVARLSPRSDELDPRNPQRDETFLLALNASIPAVAEFAKVADAAAEFDSAEASTAIRECLHKMDGLARSNPPRAEREYVSFIAQELFVMLVASLVRNERWATLKATLGTPLLDDRGAMRYWLDFGRYIRILDEYRNRKLGLNRASVASDIYNQRHRDENKLALVSPMSDIEDADFLLMLITAYLPQIGEPDNEKWIPRISLSIDRVPDWLARMRSRTHGARILGLLQMQADVNDVEARMQVFVQHFRVATRVNQRVWPGAHLYSLAELRQELVPELFTLP